MFGSLDIKTLFFSRTKTYLRIFDLNDMSLDTNILLQKIKQNHFYLQAFLGGITSLFAWKRLLFKMFEDFILKRIS